MNVVQLAHLVFCDVQYKPARFPAFQQRSTFIQDPLIRPEKIRVFRLEIMSLYMFWWQSTDSLNNISNYYYYYF